MAFVKELSTSITPWDAFQRICDLPWALFLDSSREHEELGRYAFITADPIDRVEYRPDSGAGVPRPYKSSVGPARPHEKRQPCRDIFGELEGLLSRSPKKTLGGLPPFQGGIAGLFSYDLLHCIEEVDRPKFDEFEMPYVAVGLYSWVIGFDLVEDRAWIISQSLPGRITEDDAGRTGMEILKRLDQRLPPVFSNGSRGKPNLAPQFDVPALPGLTSNFSRDDYLKAIEQAIKYIHAGDIFQANLSQRLLYQSSHSPLDIYERLRTRNPANFSAYFDAGTFQIASASPERFLWVNEREIETRPIKGTRRRKADLAEDAAAKEELFHSTKDRAENVMIVDLLRNDLSKVSEPESVTVPKLFNIESAEYVHHLVSEVRARLLPDTTPLAVLKACFPGGSITGAPKVRAMEIISELEPTARGAYCGSLVYIGFDGAMDSSILIRTFTFKDDWIQFPVGGGIVAQSEPEEEYAETMHKAEGMLRALA